jgi:hypothetical protein
VSSATPFVSSMPPSWRSDRYGCVTAPQAGHQGAEPFGRLDAELEHQQLSVIWRILEAPGLPFAMCTRIRAARGLSLSGSALTDARAASAPPANSHLAFRDSLACQGFRQRLSAWRGSWRQSSVSLGAHSSYQSGRGLPGPAAVEVGAEGNQGPAPRLLAGVDWR